MRRVLFSLALAAVCGNAWALSGYTWEELQEIKRKKWEEKKLELQQEMQKLQSEREAERAILDREYSYRVDEDVITVREPKSHEDLKKMAVTPVGKGAGAPLPGVKLPFGEGASGTDVTPGTPRPSYRRWRLKKSDFVTLNPVYDHIKLNFLPDLRYFIIPFRVTNSTGERVVIAPRVWMVTDSGRISTVVGGFLAKRAVSASMLRQVNTTQEFLASLADAGTGTEALAALEPGETRWGAAIFPPPDREMDTMKIVVEGLSNDYNFARMVRPVLVLEYERRGDEFYPQFDLTNYKGKYWAEQWMWWEETSVTRPEKVDVSGPTGKAGRSVWVFDLNLKNRTGQDQDIELERVAMLFDVEIMDGIKVTVRMPDDGEGSIYKSDAIRETAREFKAHRFLSGTIEKDSDVTMTVAMDEKDIDWEDVYRQVWAAVKPSAAAIYAAAFVGASDPAQTRKLLRFTRRGLDEDMKKKVREEVLAALDDAAGEMMRKRLMRLEVTGKAGLASGTFEVLRDFTRRTPLDESLRVVWPDVE